MTTRTTRQKDACDLLDADHKNVKALFNEYEGLTASKAKSVLAKKQEVASQICQELTIHATIEEEIFYPVVRAKIKDQDLLNEAEVEHAGARDLIAQIEASDPSDPMFDAKVTVLGEYIDHHVKEERTEMFPRARAARGLDLVALREQLEARKEELMAAA
ncbi:hemerythrin domain-containing protein [soil metagenome]